VLGESVTIKADEEEQIQPQASAKSDASNSSGQGESSKGTDCRGKPMQAEAIEDVVKAYNAESVQHPFQGESSKCADSVANSAERTVAASEEGIVDAATCDRSQLGRFTFEFSK